MFSSKAVDRAWKRRGEDRKPEKGEETEYGEREAVRT